MKFGEHFWNTSKYLLAFSVAICSIVTFFLGINSPDALAWNSLILLVNLVNMVVSYISFKKKKF